MNLSRLIVPRAGPFQRADWNGREFVVVHRRWMSAVTSWILGAVPALWVLAAKLFPKSEYVPEPDQFRPLLTISIAFALIGVALLLWKTVWKLDPSEGSITRMSGPIFTPSKCVKAANGLWLQVHPIEIKVRGTMAWLGYAAVIHASEREGVVAAASSTEVEALATARRLSDASRIRVHEAQGDKLLGSV